ncbi:MAG: hypothetical protein HRU14_15765 [Planctomycetes bacterium]|nr:hypothetical protein [Planctomycetota bacterium]
MNPFPAPPTFILCALALLGAMAPSQCVSPYLESFEAGTPTATSECGANSPGTFPVGWTNDPSGTTVWRLFSGPTPSGDTGPQGDHTTGAGNYTYVETSCGVNGPFWFGTLVAPCFDASGVQNPTLTFWYHMYGVGMGTLSVQQADAVGAWSTVHNITGDQGDEWRLAIVPVTPVNGEVRLRFFYIRGVDFRSDCCLDDIAFGEPTVGGSCVAPGIEGFEGLTPTTNFSCATNVDGEIPQGWANALDNDTDWRVLGGPTPSSGTGPTAGIGHGTGADQYIYAEVSGCTLATGSLRTPCWDATGVVSPTVEFWYHLYGASAGALYLEELRGDGSWTTRWTVSGNQGDQWNQAGALMQPVGGVVRCRFRYISGSTFEGDCALDDVRFGEPTPGDWEINGADAWFDVDGIVGSTLQPAMLRRCPGASVTLDLRSNLGPAPYDLGLTVSALVPGSFGGSVTGAGQNINIPLGNPTLRWLLGGLGPNLSTLFPGDHTLVAPTPPQPTVVSAQMYIIDQSHPDGFVLAQGSQLTVSIGQPVPGPTVDEEIVTITLGGLPVCGPASIPFFGTAYTQLNVHSNGRVSFGNYPSIDFSASPAEAMAGDPFVGFWTDLDPTNGNVTIHAPTPSAIVVGYTATYFDEPSGNVSFYIRFDAATGGVDLLGLQLIPANPLTSALATAGDRQFLGLSPGLGATDPGPVTFGVGAVGSGGSSAMLYDWYDHLSGHPSLVPSLQTGNLYGIFFSPNGQGGYDWTGL